MKPRLVVTADDVGLHEGMTSGVLEAHREGIVTACSVVANGAAFDDAVRRLQDVPGLDVGVHLTLVEERPLTNGSEISSLVDASGRFSRNFRMFCLRYAAGRVRGVEVERELRAQIERVLDAGISPSHLNGHQHLHVLPAVFDLVCRLGVEYKIPFVRVPLESAPAHPLTLGRKASIRALVAFGRGARSRLSRTGLATSDTTRGIHDAGNIDVARLTTLLSGLQGLTELVVHPGRGDAEISRVYDWGYAWDAERSALSDPTMRTLLEQQGVRLCSVRDALSPVGAVESSPA